MFPVRPICLLLAWLFTTAPALAQPVAPAWSGVDLSIVEGLHIPRPDGYTSGVTADYKGGLVRVFVGPSDVAASWWVSRMTQVVEKQKPRAVPYPAASPTSGSAAAPASTLPVAAPTLNDTADELWVSGDRLVIVRTANVGIMVEVASGAMAKADAIAAALLPAPSEPLAAPTLLKVGTEWRIDVPLTEPPLQLRYEGGRLSGAPGLTFSEPPSAAVAYDHQGRMSRRDFDPMGLVIEVPPPWQDHVISQRPPAVPASSPEPK